MTTVLAQPNATAGLYPPTVEAPPRPLPLRRFLFQFVRNPLASLPRPVYEQPIVVHDNGRYVVAWVTGPALIEQVLLHAGAQFPKTPLEKRVFEHDAGRRHPHLRGRRAGAGSGARRRRCSAPPISPAWCRP